LVFVIRNRPLCSTERRVTAAQRTAKTISSQLASALATPRSLTIATRETISNAPRAIFSDPTSFTAISDEVFALFFIIDDLFRKKHAGFFVFIMAVEEIDFANGSVYEKVRKF
jgi:hypothetical protein